jgi:hypothetical protein
LPTYFSNCPEELYIKISLIIKECPEESLIKVAIFLEISKYSQNTELFIISGSLRVSRSQ